MIWWIFVAVLTIGYTCVSSLEPVHQVTLLDTIGLPVPTYCVARNLHTKFLCSYLLSQRQSIVAGHWSIICGHGDQTVEFKINRLRCRWSRDFLRSCHSKAASQKSMDNNRSEQHRTSNVQCTQPTGHSLSHSAFNSSVKPINESGHQMINGPMVRYRSVFGERIWYDKLYAIKQTISSAWAWFERLAHDCSCAIPKLAQLSYNAHNITRHDSSKMSPAGQLVSCRDYDPQCLQQTNILLFSAQKRIPLMGLTGKLSQDMRWLPMKGELVFAAAVTTLAQSLPAETIDA